MDEACASMRGEEHLSAGPGRAHSSIGNEGRAIAGSVEKVNWSEAEAARGTGGTEGANGIHINGTRGASMDVEDCAKQRTAYATPAASAVDREEQTGAGLSSDEGDYDSATGGSNGRRRALTFDDLVCHRKLTIVAPLFSLNLRLICCSRNTFTFPLTRLPRNWAFA